MWAGRIWEASTKWEQSLVMQDEEGKLGEADDPGSLRTAGVTPASLVLVLL